MATTASAAELNVRGVVPTFADTADLCRALDNVYPALTGQVATQYRPLSQ